MASDPSRTESEVGAALLRLYYSIFLSLDAFEDAGKRDDAAKANGRALLEKLHKRIGTLLR